MYFGYATHDIDKAIKQYTKRTGHEPTAIVVRPTWKVNRESSLIVRSRFGSGSGILVTHLITVAELCWREETLKVRQVEIDHSEPIISNGNYSPESVPKHLPGRPKQNGGKCPHCGNLITNFNDLGHWHGWAFGIEPPYWQELRLFIFRRDHYTCQRCQQRLTLDKLRCHHMIAKEIGGSDSARNLVTLCGECHIDEHPIFPGEDA